MELSHKFPKRHNIHQKTLPKILIFIFKPGPETCSFPTAQGLLQLCEELLQLRGKGRSQAVQLRAALGQGARKGLTAQCLEQAVLCSAQLNNVIKTHPVTLSLTL